MNTITRHIQYLASRHDCVIIPGIGGILATHVPARDLGDGSWTSPGRSYTFNPSLRHNDGLLACSISRAAGIPYEAAMQVIESEVTAMCHQLESDGEYPLGQLGYLSRGLDEAGVAHIDFHPHQAEALSVDTFWLPQVRRKADTASAEVDGGERRDALPVRPVRFRRLREMARTAAVIVAVFAFYCLVSNPIAVDHTVYASLAPEIQKTDASDLLPDYDYDYDYDSDSDQDSDSDHDYDSDHDSDTDQELQDESGSVTVDVDVPAAAAQQPVYVPVDQGGDYYVIVASLATYDQALEYLQMPSHQRLNLLESDGRYRVYSTSHPTAASAQRALNATVDTYPGAWVFHK